MTTLRISPVMNKDVGMHRPVHPSERGDRSAPTY